MQARQSDWVDAIRYLRGLGRPRRHRIEFLVQAVALLVLAVLTVLAAVAQFG